MRLLVVFCLPLLLVLSGCADIKQSEEYKRVAFDRDSLLETLNDREAEVLAFAREFDAIEKNLSAIDTNKTKLLAMRSQDRESQKERIHTLIADIYIALDQNQTSLKNLESTFAAGPKMNGLQTIVSSLKENLEAKEDEIQRLQKQLVALELEINSLKDALAFKEKQLLAKDTILTQQTARIQKQDQVIQQKEAEMTRAYYFRGTMKELEKAGIIRKEGGIAGLGSVKVLGEKLGTDKLKIVNVKKDKMLLIGRYKKKKVVSSHPFDSYFFLAKDGQIYLKISHPERFWSVSRYLVIAVE